MEPRTRERGESAATRGHRTILVPVDFSAFSRAAIERALALARIVRAEVSMLHVLQLPQLALDFGRGGADWSLLRTSEQERLDALQKEFADRGVPVSARLEEGDPFEVIEAAGRAPDVELIVMGSHGLRGLDRLLMGSVAERTVRRATKPVLIVRESEQDASKPIRSMLFATDFSDTAQHLESSVAEWAKRLDAEIVAVHVIFDTASLLAPYVTIDTSEIDAEVQESAERQMAAVVERLRATGARARPIVAHGFPAEKILALAEEERTDLIALGTRGQTRLRSFPLGSVAQRILAGAACGVLVAGPAEALSTPKDD